MKKPFIAILAVCTLFAAAPLMADEVPASQMGGAPGSQVQTPESQPEGAPGSQVQSPEQKDECLLYSKRCLQTAESLQQKMRRLDTEIKKGTKVYTPEELKRLQDKLKDLNDLMDRMLDNP
ncbi:hypothetical protein [Geobacter sp. SVR]|uniref:hypothetical protein n=1 Tax=Geobacter sp. SVR TaxID=2495594 RepID=UPI00143EFA0D|nr:hypothetical protein [Geobacter sp. SVR]BCS54290.1 hypothetical protein GSVR_25980 [Geobacter sp. SVR]GCF85851.1 hypothetical protein GSbR_24510 [Geobacter sp. SVR]